MSDERKKALARLADVNVGMRVQSIAHPDRLGTVIEEDWSGVTVEWDDWQKKKIAREGRWPRKFLWEKMRRTDS